MQPENIQGKSNAGPKSVRLLRPSIVVLCGPAACGKSTFAARHFRPTQIISSDWARAHICDDERDQRYNAQAFALVHFLIEQRLTVNRLCVVDSTALTTQARHKLVELAKRYQVPATMFLFDVPLETCIERDEKRERSVGRAVIERHYQAFKLAQETIPQEGYDQVLEIQNDDLETIQIEVLFRPVVRPPQRPERPEQGTHFGRPASPRDPTKQRPTPALARHAQATPALQPSTSREAVKTSESATSTPSPVSPRPAAAEDAPTSDEGPS